MRRLILGLVLTPVAYIACAALLHFVVFREGPVPDEAYPRPGTIYSSQVEGLESRVISRDNDQELKRVRVQPGAAGPPEHIHLDLEEEFHLIEGELVFVLNGVEQIVKAGKWVRIPPNTAHRFFNRSETFAVYELNAPRSHTLFTSQLYGFTNEHGPLSEDPRSALLQMSRFHADSWRPAPPIPVQRILYFLVEPTARLLGYKRFYPQYIPQPAI